MLCKPLPGALFLGVLCAGGEGVLRSKTLGLCIGVGVITTKSSKPTMIKFSELKRIEA